MRKEDEGVIDRMIGSMEKSVDVLEDTYEKKDTENFNKIKRFMLQINRKILEEIK